MTSLHVSYYAAGGKRYVWGDVVLDGARAPRDGAEVEVIRDVVTGHVMRAFPEVGSVVIVAWNEMV